MSTSVRKSMVIALAAAGAFALGGVSPQDAAAKDCYGETVGTTGTVASTAQSYEYGSCQVQARIKTVYKGQFLYNSGPWGNSYSFTSRTGYLHSAWASFK